MTEILTVTLNPDAAPDPVYVLEAAEAAAEAVRVVNRLTLHHEALHYPSEAYGLIQHLASLAGRLPQAAAQAGTWLEREQRAGGLAVPEGGYAGRPDAAVADALAQLRRAGDDALRLRRDLAEAAEIMAGIAAAGDDGSEEGEAADEPGTA